MKRALITLPVVALIAVYGYSRRTDLLRLLPVDALPIPAHDQYAFALTLSGVAASADGVRWREAAAASLDDAGELAAQHSRTLLFRGEPGQAAAWRVDLRRGQRLMIELAAGPGTIFMDVFRADTRAQVSSAAPRARHLEHLAHEDGEVIVRLQPPLGFIRSVIATQVVAAGFRFPVPTVSDRKVQSAFGAARDRGARRHEGIDIFAPRDTPVVAVADGWIGAQTTNRLGGNVVWLWVPTARVSLYYAHLARQAVHPGDRVTAGDVVGYIGNTGNASTTRPHLHFGVYSTADGAVDPAPFVVDPPTGTSGSSSEPDATVRGETARAP